MKGILYATNTGKSTHMSTTYGSWLSIRFVKIPNTEERGASFIV